MAKKPKSKSKHKLVQAWKKYKVSGDTVERSQSCPRCGAGTFLAQHKDRVTCGRCGLSEMKNKK